MSKEDESKPLTETLRLNKYEVLSDNIRIHKTGPLKQV
jgi:hypothetical protein